MKIVAELSCNHHGSLERALDLVQHAATAGAHAVKLQTWHPDLMVLDKGYVLRDGPWVGTNLHELYQHAHTPWDWHLPIYNRAHELGIECFSSVFDVESLTMLEHLGCPRYKIASFELVDLPLLQAVAGTGKPMILSTGMASYEEINDACETARRYGCNDLTLLKCTSAYPADGSSANLAAMTATAAKWEAKPGLSDHTPGIGVALAAIAMGATMIEKHLIESRAQGGYDAAFSIEPHELDLLVREAKGVRHCWGDARIGPTPHEKPQLALRRSLYFARDMAKGTLIEPGDVRTARPAKGLQPRHKWRLMGAEIATDVRAGQPVSWDVVSLKPLVDSPAVT